MSKKLIAQAEQARKLAETQRLIQGQRVARRLGYSKMHMGRPDHWVRIPDAKRQRQTHHVDAVPLPMIVQWYRKFDDSRLRARMLFLARAYRAAFMSTNAVAKAR